MNLASLIVVSVLLWCLGFLLALPFGVERGVSDANNFGGVTGPHLWYKVIFATIVSLLGTAGCFFVAGQGYLDGIFR